MTIETTEKPHKDLGSFDQRDAQVMSYLGLDPRRPADRAAVAVCRHYGFDPLLKHVVVIPKGGVYITRDGLLHVAHRSGQLDGIVVDQEPTLVGEEWVCRVSVYRKDMGHPFTFPGRYPEKGNNRDYGPEMALKAAEAHALRRAFDVTGLPALDEQRPGERRPSHAERKAASGLAAALAPESTEDVGGAKGGAATEESGGSSVAAAGGDVVEGEIVEDPPGEPESPLLDMRSQLAKKLFAVMGEAGITDERQHEFLSKVLGRAITSRKDLTEGDARLVIEATEDALENPLGDQ